jgi:GAF domain-containing protein
MGQEFLTLSYRPGELPIASSYAQLVLRLHAADSVPQVAQTVVDFARLQLPCAYAALILTSRGRGSEIAAATDDAAYQLSALDLPSARGRQPTGSTDAVILVPDTEIGEAAPPVWSSQARRMGIRSTAHFQLGLSTRSIGVLALHSLEPDGFTAQDLSAGTVLARHAAIALASARQRETMAEAVEAKMMVSQAVGILMERFDLDHDAPTRF